MSALCAVEGCGRVGNQRSWCHAHYERWRRGKPLGGPFLDTIEKRFMAKVVKQPDGCWLWTAATDGGKRYGSIQHRGKVRRAHRVAYELFVGPVDDDLDIDHLCRVTLCVNPAHMEPVTHRENLRRGNWGAGINARKTHCKWGHEFTPENIKWRGTYRICVACTAARRARGREQRLAAERRAA